MEEEETPHLHRLKEKKIPGLVTNQVIGFPRSSASQCHQNAAGKDTRCRLRQTNIEIARINVSPDWRRTSTKTGTAQYNERMDWKWKFSDFIFILNKTRHTTFTQRYSSPSKDKKPQPQQKIKLERVLIQGRPLKMAKNVHRNGNREKKRTTYNSLIRIKHAEKQSEKGFLLKSALPRNSIFKNTNWYQLHFCLARKKERAKSNQIHLIPVNKTKRTKEGF